MRRPETGKEGMGGGGARKSSGAPDCMWLDGWLRSAGKSTHNGGCFVVNTLPSKSYTHVLCNSIRSEIVEGKNIKIGDAKKKMDVIP